MFNCKPLKDKEAKILLGIKAMKTVAMVIIASILIGCFFVNMVTANPYAPYKDYPLKPNTTPPTIAIQLPESERTYNSNSVSCKINIQEPIELLDNTLGNNTIKFGKINYIACIIDGKDSFTILNYTKDLSGDIFKQNLTLNGELPNLPDGKHSLQILVACDRYYHDPRVPYDMPFWWDSPPLIYSMETRSSQIQFIISANNSDTSNEIRNTTFAELAVFVSLALVISALIFFYRRHRKTTHHTKEKA